MTRNEITAVLVVEREIHFETGNIILFTVNNENQCDPKWNTTLSLSKSDLLDVVD